MKKAILVFFMLIFPRSNILLSSTNYSLDFPGGRNYLSKIDPVNFPIGNSSRTIDTRIYLPSKRDGTGDVIVSYWNQSPSYASGSASSFKRSETQTWSFL